MMKGSRTGFLRVAIFPSINSIVKLKSTSGKKDSVVYLEFTIAAQHDIDSKQLEDMNKMFFPDDVKSAGDTEPPIYIAVCPDHESCKALVLNLAAEVSAVREFVGYTTPRTSLVLPPMARYTMYLEALVGQTSFKSTLYAHEQVNALRRDAADSAATRLHNLTQQAIIRLLLATIILQRLTLRVHAARYHVTVVIQSQRLATLVSQMMDPARKQLLLSWACPRMWLPNKEAVAV
ncbi:unnamed protein product [Peronospora destructor]|uniref:Arp2/3 complex 34 kDa subunit n=1 Tax=Peronospora destructor TaxID=86335 RepID=A0AAV0VEA9_9STRA|nr:unnamed protein product [Peronospora destructor]